MKYLFFDEESIHNKHKYSYTFGYVVCDENFKIIKDKEDLVFNPDLEKEEYDWRVVRKMMGYPIHYLNKQKKFTHYYDKIKKLMENKETICIGFQVDEDVKYLLNNCLRYELDSINFQYIDLRDIIKILTGKKASSLAKEYMKWCNCLQSDAHRSDVDAEMTMKVMKEILKNYKTTLPELIASNPKLKGISKDFCFGCEENLEDILIPKEKTNKRNRILKQGQEDWILHRTLNFTKFLYFLDNVKPNQECEQIFKDKKISISLNYEMYHLQNMLKLVQLITNAGGTYVKKASLSNIFVKDPNCFDDDGNIKRCSKLEYVNEAISSNGAKIEIMEFDDFLKLLNLNIEQLNELSPIDLTYLENEKYAR